MLLIGESETLEFKERVQKETPSNLAKAAVAFANTKGGTIVIGVDDDGRVIGCETKGLGDTVTNVLRTQCDPPPLIETEVVQYQDKSLLLVKVMQSKDRVHILKDHGPLIRANATNRVPTADELTRLCSRHAGGLNFTLNP
jgi:ATP-dependent DNA helicase RecG